MYDPLHAAREIVKGLIVTYCYIIFIVFQHKTMKYLKQMCMTAGHPQRPKRIMQQQQQSPASRQLSSLIQSYGIYFSAALLLWNLFVGNGACMLCLYTVIQLDMLLIHLTKHFCMDWHEQMLLLV